MRKLVGAINMTLDGFCDHTFMNADDELHQHYTDLLREAGIILYGRITYQLMEYWRTVVQDPTGNKSTDEFAQVIDKIPKLVFSRTLKHVEWETASLARKEIQQEVQELKQQAGKDILVGSRSLIISLLNLQLIDELQLCIHPVIAGKGLSLFENVKEKTVLELFNKKLFDSGSIVLYYKLVITDH